MKRIIKYKAIDGKEFENSEDCLNYESLIHRVDTIMGQLTPKPNDDGCKFSNGHGFIQHNTNTVTKVKNEILELCKIHIDHPWIQQSIDDPEVHSSWVGRLLSDYNISPLNNAWYRFSCIDNLGREFGQPYFVDNPEKATLVSIKNKAN